jgi:predicted lipid-binding transport protein (Tim44 family)
LAPRTRVTTPWAVAGLARRARRRRSWGYILAGLAGGLLCGLGLIIRKRFNKQGPPGLG